MRLIIAGSRHYPREIAKHYIDRLYRAYFSEFHIEEVISGGNGSIRKDGVPIGVDKAGEEWAAEKGFYVKEPFLPDWSRGKRAGPERNALMAEHAGPDGGLILVWDGESRGSRNMLLEARIRGLFIRGVKPSDVHL